MGKFITLTLKQNGKPILVNVDRIESVHQDYTLKTETTYIEWEGGSLAVQESLESIEAMIARSCREDGFVHDTAVLYVKSTEDIKRVMEAMKNHDTHLLPAEGESALENVKLAKDGTLSVYLNVPPDQVTQVVVSRKGSIFGEIFLRSDEKNAYEERWNELKETIEELRDNNLDKEEVARVLKFLCNLMEVV